MSAPFTNSLGGLQVERTLPSDPALPRVEAVHPDGRVLHARVLAATAHLDPSALAAFDAAARTVSRLTHPSIAAPCVWSASAPLFVAAEAVDGETLASLAERNLMGQVVSALGVDLAEALEAAHAAGIVHGGVGLDAVMVSREGRAILGDFAIAGLASALANTHSQLLGSVAATLTPEHLNDLPTSAATDVFALGSLLYRLLAGAYPFDAPSPMGMTLKLSMGTFDRLESKAPATPSGLGALVHRMLAPSPSDRPSAREVVSALLELGPREDARRQRIRAILPPAPERAAPPVPTSTPPPSEPSPSLGIGPQAAIPPSTPGDPAPEWVDSMSFEEGAATEYQPELARAIEADAGIASPLLNAPREPARRMSAPPPRMSTPHSRAESPTPIALYAVIALSAIVILAGTVVIAVALAG